jgi:hypothetical protein
LRVNDLITTPLPAAALRSRALHYYALHGRQRLTYWWGEPVTLTDQLAATLPATAAMIDLPLVTAAAPAHTVVCAGVCQAAYILGKTVDSSLALRFITEGALCFIGPTTMAYEYEPVLPGPLDGIDRLFADVLSGLFDDIPIGQAVVEAKRSHTLLDPPDEKNVHSLVLYGDPGLKITRKEAS